MGSPAFYVPCTALKQSTPDAPHSLCFDLKMLLPADIVMDIGIVFFFSFFFAHCPEVGGLLTHAPTHMNMCVCYLCW